MHKRFATGAALAIALWTCCWHLAQAAEPTPVDSASRPASRMLKGGVNQLAVLCAAAGLNLAKPGTPSTVLKVRLGSTAAYSGIRQGDMILDAKIDRNILSVTVERSGKKFQARMAVDSNALKSMITEAPAVPEKLQAQTPTNAQLPANAEPYHTQPNAVGLSKEITEAEAAKILADYKLIVLVDRSGSMTSPTSASNPISKLDWLKDQMNSFGLFLTSNTKDGLCTLIEFSSEHTKYVDITPNEAASIVSSLQAKGGTDIATPLEDALDMALSEKGHHLIVVLSDGMDNLGPSLPETIIQATRKVTNPADLVISFIEIGDSSEGMISIRDLDQNLVAKGAAYDIVDARYFADVVQFGLKRILADAVLRARSPRH